MPEITQELVFYEQEHHAINFPSVFLKNLARKSSIPHLSSDAAGLLKLKAYLALGDFSSVLTQIKNLNSQKKQSYDDFLLAKLYLIHNQAVSSAIQNPKLAGELLGKAIIFGKRCNSKILQCEIITADCIAQMNEMELTHSEDILHQAMLLATESGWLDSVILVHLSYILLYHNQLLPDAANRELQMLQEICSAKQNPYYYTLLQNHFGINNLMLQNYPQAEKSLQKGLNIAEENGYLFQMASLLINSGILDRRRKDPSAAVKHYQEAYRILENCGAKDSQLAEKAIDNLGLALSAQGKLQEAADIHKQALIRAKQKKDKDREGMQQVNLADVLIEMEQFQEAEGLLNNAIGYYTETRNYSLLQNSWLCKARLFEAQEQYQEAFNCMEELYQVTQLHFRQSFSRQSDKLTRRIADLRNEYMLIRSRCNGAGTIDNELLGNPMIGDHPKLKAALNMAIQAAKYPYVNVMISGESGTGKEIIARLIHANSVSNRAMVAVNASALPPNLMESELFGHVRGSFTGAVSDHKGKFVQADRSTLFLDEISEMPLELQAKLLRAIETHSITPVGGNRDIAVNCRIISATNRKMSELIHKNLFRLDLYHRLNKVEIHLPPLRERLSDLELLCEHFVERFAKEFALPVPKLEDSFYSRLQKYHFPGNIRELMNIVERIFILKPKLSWDRFQLDGLVDETPNQSLVGTGSIQENMEQTEYQLILGALQKANWVQKEAARLLGMTESTLSRHKKRLGIIR